MFPKRVSVALLVCWVLIVPACSRPQRVDRASQFRPRDVREAVSVEDRRRVDENCGPFGSPETSTTWNFGPTRIVARDGYALLHSSTDKIPIWVCEHITAAEISTPATAVRRDRFAPDPLLPVGSRAELSDYRGSGYDRGHMAPAGDFTQDQRLKDETFYLSNMSPQNGPLNRQIWKELEEKVRAWAAARGEAYVFTGPMFFDPAEETSQADGMIEYWVIGPNAVAVPTHFYKIVVRPGGTAGTWEAIAFVLENRGYSRPYNFQHHVQSIDWIEARTGLDFIPTMPRPQQDPLEAATPTVWP